MNWDQWIFTSQLKMWSALLSSFISIYIYQIILSSNLFFTVYMGCLVLSMKCDHCYVYPYRLWHYWSRQCWLTPLALSSAGGQKDEKEKRNYTLSHLVGNSPDFLSPVSFLSVREAAYCMYASVWVIGWQQKSLLPLFRLHAEWQLLTDTLHITTRPLEQASKHSTNRNEVHLT